MAFEKATDFVYVIYDKGTGEYVSKTTVGYGGGGRGKKTAWQKPGQAKSAAMIVMRYLDRIGENMMLKDGVKKLEHFKDQERFQIHKMQLQFVEIAP